MNVTIKNVVDNVFKYHKLFFINIGSYRDILVQTWPLFDNFWSLKLYVQYDVFNCLKYDVSICPMVCPNFSLKRLAVFELKAN